MVEFILIFIIGLGVLLWVAWREGVKYGSSMLSEVTGILSLIPDRTLSKQKKLNTILSLFEEREEISNSYIRKRIKVSSRTVVRYMDVLEKQGLIKQVGKTGKNVTYKLR